MCVVNIILPQALNSVKIFESETRAKDKDSENDERLGMTAGQGLLYTG
jgi:hypothetical protein